MFDDTAHSSPSSAIVALEPLEPEWQPILHASNQVVLYNPTSHALSIQRRSPTPRAATVVRRVLTVGRCPYCHRSISNPRTLGEDDRDSDTGEMEDTEDSKFEFDEILFASSVSVRIPAAAVLKRDKDYW